MNHFAKNLITKGWLNISALTKGFILPYFRYVIRRRGGGTYDGYGEENFYRDLRKNKPKDIDVIEVYVDWNKKKTKHDKKIYVELIKKKIEVKLLKEHKEYKDIKIDVKLEEQKKR